MSLTAGDDADWCWKVTRSKANVADRERSRIRRLRLLGNLQNLFVDVERRFGLAVDVDDVAELLQRAEDEERVDEQREELADGDLAREDQVEHQEHDAGAQEVHRRALDEAQAAQVADLLQLELQDLARGGVQPVDLLLCEAQALHELDVAQRLGRRPGERRRLGDDHLLNLLDPPAQHRAEHAEDRHGQEVGRRDDPVHGEGVDHHEDDADERREQDVDGRRDELLDVGADLLQPAERFAAALVLEHRIRQLERVADAVGVQLRAEPLGDDVDVVVLEVLRDARDEGDADRGAEQQADAPEELSGRVFLEPRRVVVDDVPEDQRVEQREDLIDGGQGERQRDQAAIVPKVAVEKLHGFMSIIPRGQSRRDDFAASRLLFAALAHPARLPEMASVVRADDVQAGGQAEAHPSDERVRKSHAGQIQVAVGEEERADVALRRGEAGEGVREAWCRARPDEARRLAFEGRIDRRFEAAHEPAADDAGHCRTATPFPGRPCANRGCFHRAQVHAVGRRQMIQAFCDAPGIRCGAPRCLGL